MKLKNLKTPQEIGKAFEAFLELDPLLPNTETFIERILCQQNEGFEIVAVFEGEEVVACIGFRIMTMLSWRKFLYIENLITKEKNRGKGYGKILLDHVMQIAKASECEQIHLDTGYERHAAHKLYLKYGFEFDCHHLSMRIK